MKCPNCGKEVRQNQARFCPHCGQRLDGATFTSGENTEPLQPRTGTVAMPDKAAPSAGAEKEPVMQQGPVVQQETGRKNSGKGHRGIILVLVAVIIVAAAAIVFMWQKKQDEEPAAELPAVQTTAPAVQKEDNTVSVRPTVNPTLAPIPTAAPTLAPIPTATPTPTPTATVPQATPLPVLPGLEVQPNVMSNESERTVMRVATESSRLNMRSGPGTDYDVVGKAEHDALVTEVGTLLEDSSWIVIESEGVYGWVSAQYLSPVS